jgi:hypothetical protein
MRCSGSTLSWCNSFASAVAVAKVSPNTEEHSMSIKSATGLAFGGRTCSNFERMSDAACGEKNERSGGRSGPEVVTAPANLVASSPWSSRTMASRRSKGSSSAAPLLPASIRVRKTTWRDLSENWSNTSLLHTTASVCVSLRLRRTGKLVQLAINPLSVSNRADSGSRIICNYLAQSAPTAFSILFRIASGCCIMLSPDFFQQRQGSWGPIGSSGPGNRGSCVFRVSSRQPQGRILEQV